MSQRRIIEHYNIILYARFERLKILQKRLWNISGLVWVYLITLHYKGGSYQLCTHISATNYPKVGRGGQKNRKQFVKHKNVKIIYNVLTKKNHIPIYEYTIYYVYYIIFVKLLL